MPIHLTILFGAAMRHGSGGLLLFGLLKTGADLLSARYDSALAPHPPITG